MQSFFRREIEWTAQAIIEKTDQLKRISEMTVATKAERELCLLKAEQFQSIAERLTAAVENGDKRIAIR